MSFETLQEESSNRIMFNPLTYFNRVANATEINGGLSFNEPIFNTSYTSLNIQNIQDNESYRQIIQQHQDNNIIQNVLKITDISMLSQSKIPITIDKHCDHDIHAKLNDALSGKGVIDMLLKIEKSDDIIIPNELKSIIPIIEKITMFEKQINPDIYLWNMWLLVDIRPVIKYMTQRNAGFHYDGFNISGRYMNNPVVSIYGWTNNLPTLFYTKGIDEKNIDNTVNLSIHSHMKANYEYTENIIMSEPNTIIKFDGTTLHAGNTANKNIYDRVFLRVCFTPPNFWFDRKGNTINPFMRYPESFIWKRICDPSIKLIAPVNFENAIEFKRLWDIACFGHHAFSIYLEGDRSYQYKLINEIRKKSNVRLIKQLRILYNTGKSIDEFRFKALLYYFEA